MKKMMTVSEVTGLIGKPVEVRSEFAGRDLRISAILSEVIPAKDGRPPYLKLNDVEESGWTDNFNFHLEPTFPGSKDMKRVYEKITGYRPYAVPFRGLISVTPVLMPVI